MRVSVAPGPRPRYSGFAAPIVYEGIAYISTGANDVFAVSLDGGDTLWRYDAKLDPNITSVCCGWNNKGVAISEDKVFIGQLDGKLVALDRSSGKVAWSIQAERWQENFSITAAPLYVRPVQKDRPSIRSTAWSSSALPAAIAARAVASRRTTRRTAV